MNAKHTPGPWTYGMQTGFNDLHIISAKQGKLRIAELDPFDRLMTEEIAANARLIAAAPELLEALARILYAHDTNNNGAAMGEANLCSFYATMARCAIAKAKGEA